GVADALALGHLLVVRLACIGAAQLADPLAGGVDNDDVLVTVGFLLPTVVEPLFFWVFRALAPPLGAVYDQLRRLVLLPLVLREPLRVAFGEAAQALQGAHEDWQQPVDPTVDLGLAQVEEAAQQLLQRIGLLVEEDEQQFVFRTQQDGLTATTGSVLAWLARLSLSGGKGMRVSACESR